MELFLFTRVMFQKPHFNTNKYQISIVSLWLAGNNEEKHIIQTKTTNTMSKVTRKKMKRKLLIQQEILVFSLYVYELNL